MYQPALLALAVLLAQIEYKVTTTRTFYAISVIGVDAANQPRRMLFKLSHAGNVYAGRYDVAVSIETRQRVAASRFRGSVGIACGASVTSRPETHSPISIDAETPGINAILTQAEFEALIKCQSPRLSVGGIEVRFEKQQLGRIRMLRWFVP